MKKLLMILMVATLSCATVSAQKPAKATSVATQCIAKTQKGTRCKLEIVTGSKYCPIHQPVPKDKQCKAKTKKGKRCSRAAVKSGYCSQHYKMHKQGKL